MGIADAGGLGSDDEVTGKHEFQSTRHRDPALAARALAAHPLIDSLGAGRAALVDYCAEVPAIAAAVGWRPEKRVR